MIMYNILLSKVPTGLVVVIILILSLILGTLTKLADKYFRDRRNKKKLDAYRYWYELGYHEGYLSACQNIQKKLTEFSAEIEQEESRKNEGKD